MTIAFIGGGNMASAIVGGLVAARRPASEFVVVDPNPSQRNMLSQRFGVIALDAPDARVRAADAIVLAVKPQQMREAAMSLLPLSPRCVVITIAAGIRLADLSRWLNGHTVLVRAMPNTPALIHQGITGMFAAHGVAPDVRALADDLLRAVGPTLWLQREDMLDAVTAVSGSGPAYVFYVIEALQEAALSLGFDAAQARQLALQTFAGATALAVQSDEPPSALRARVTSRGGTTERALEVLEGAEVKAHFVEAVRAAAVRSRELGDELGRAGDLP